MIPRQPPAFYGLVQERARQRWIQLEGDPELAGPWKQLFRQVQSPRHVVSELLQNADDARATRVQVSTNDGLFLFEHNGKDFDREDFASLCRFGFSNKRTLHTIGFRGVGFKSTFSLGETVEVLTPTLAVRFQKQRFTEPIWIDHAPSCDVTRIAVRVRDLNREQKLRKNIQEWVESPDSLLFFNSISELTIDGVTMHKKHIGPGRVPGAERVRLTSRDQREVLVLNSMEEPFPREAVDEIRQERDLEDLHLPPCRVALVVGLPGKQRLYVVLPTGVLVDTPFSCNAPFLQDPARVAIKDPSLSPTNRWLLHRLGSLAAKAMLERLRNPTLGIEVRAEAYRFLPEKPVEGDSLDANATSAICHGFAATVGNQPVCLITAGRVVEAGSCIAPPRRTYDVWTPVQLLQVFGAGEEYVLCGAVAEEPRRRLRSWGWLASEEDLIERLAGERQVPRPKENSNLLALWSVVQESVRHDYGGQQRRRLAIVPVEGADVLLPAQNVVRLSTKAETINDESWSFIVRLLHVMDRRWAQYLGSDHGNNDAVGPARQLLHDLNLDRPSDANAIVANACRNLFRCPRVSAKDYVRIAHLMAALDARTPAEFRCITRDGQQRKQDDGVIATRDPSVQAILPEEWAGAHVLHEAYFTRYTACTRQRWNDWISSDKSPFWPSAPICGKRNSVWGRQRLAKALKLRGVNPPADFPYVDDNFYLNDHDFEDVLLAHWQSLAKADGSIWSAVLRCVIAAPSSYWESHTDATVFQVARGGWERKVHTGPMVASWILRFRDLPCLPDTHGSLRLPAELYLRTPETEPLIGVEPFVRAELDTEATKPLLRLLGVRETPVAIGNLLERLRALARIPDPTQFLSEIVKWYGAIDRVLPRCDASNLHEVCDAFANEPLILTGAGEWAKASEIFQFASEDFPDAPIVHSAANNLGMWSRLGVASRPTVNLVLAWLKSLPSGQPLEAGAMRRVRAAQQRYPVQVWQTCQHWLALDGAWTAVPRLRFRLTMHSLTRWSDLFPAIKAATANLQMLSAEVCDCSPFASLPDLGTCVEYRLTRLPQSTGKLKQGPWLAALARALMRIKLTDETATQRVREIAAGLEHTVWQAFDDHDSIQVTPYVENAPAGQPHSPDVLWYEESVFVRKGGLARSFDSLVAELARPFSNEAITEAIKACIERDEDFIAEYMENHFTLEAELAPPPNGSECKRETGKEEAEGEADTNGKAASVTTEVYEEGAARERNGTEDEGERGDGTGGRSHQHKLEPSLFERFVVAKGYRWDAGRQVYLGPDGFSIKRCEPPFSWRRFDPAGNVVTSYWASEHCLARGGGVEIASELWELFRKSQTECSMILIDEENRPMELHGPDLLKMVEDKVIKLYPAKYRLRQESNS